MKKVFHNSLSLRPKDPDDGSKKQFYIGFILMLSGYFSLKLCWCCNAPIEAQITVVVNVSFLLTYCCPLFFLKYNFINKCAGHISSVSISLNLAPQSRFWIVCAGK